MGHSCTRLSILVLLFLLFFALTDSDVGVFGQLVVEPVGTFSQKKKQKKTKKKKHALTVHVNFLNPFTAEFLKWTLLSLNLDGFIISKRDVA